MKKYNMFIIIVMCILAFQFCMDGFLSFCEQARAGEELCRAKESSTHKITRVNYPREASAEQPFHILPTQCLGHCSVAFVLITLEDFSIILAKLFNHSPPALIS